VKINLGRCTVNKAHVGKKLHVQSINCIMAAYCTIVHRILQTKLVKRFSSKCRWQ